MNTEQNNNGNMLLSKYNLNKIGGEGLSKPPEGVFAYPETVLQFGTGVLLRGLPDYYIDKANRMGLYQGRAVVVKSTGSGPAAEFDRQDGLYTLHIRGVEHGRAVSEQVISSAISRVLSAPSEWAEVLKVAQSAELRAVISNTTEVGIQLVQEDIKKQPPTSFPGKLLAVLYERYKAFGGSAESGLVIVPTELIVDNGKKLEAIVLELAHLNKLEPAFMDWLEEHNHFCNSLVDRIVPGKPDPATLTKLEAETGYQDELRIVSEVYSLWAIEGDERVKEALPFYQADKGMIIVPDIGLYRELKLRLLNGTHTLSCALAYLSGFATVRAAMDDEGFVQFISKLMLDEIAPAIPYTIDPQEAKVFAMSVLDRFRNPSIEHQWISISAQYSSKLKMRVVPLLVEHYKKSSQVPQLMAMGFAAYLRFMQSEKNEEGTYQGSYQGKDYTLTDSQAGVLSEAWQQHASNTQQLVSTILADKTLWDTDLSQLPGFAQSVTQKLNTLMEQGAGQLLSNNYEVA